MNRGAYADPVFCYIYDMINYILPIILLVFGLAGAVMFDSGYKWISAMTIIVGVVIFAVNIAIDRRS